MTRDESDYRERKEREREREKKKLRKNTDLCSVQNKGCGGGHRGKERKKKK